MYYFAVSLLVWLAAGLLTGLYIITSKDFKRNFEKACNDSGLDKFVSSSRKQKSITVAAATLMGFIGFFSIISGHIKSLLKK